MSKLQKRVLWAALAVAGLFVCVYGAFSLWDASQTAALLDETATVIVDAGHGGEDGGTTSVSGMLESQLNLQIAMKCRDLLGFLGVRTAMVRQTDDAIYDAGCQTLREKKVSDLKNRVALVNGTPNSLLLSIHQNYFDQAKYHGAQVFYARAGGKELAGHIQDSLRLLDKGNRRQAKPAQSVYLMEHIKTTGVLIECGFLSNPEEDRRLQDGNYQKQLAAAVCTALADHLCREGTKDEV